MVLNNKHKICNKCKNVDVSDWNYLTQSNKSSTNKSINGPVKILSPLHLTTTTQIQNQIDQYENKSNERSLLFDLISDSRVKKLT